VKNRFHSTFAAVVVALAAGAALAGCSVSTAHLSDLKVTSDKDYANAATSFGANDTVYVQSGVANNPDKAVLQWHTVAEKVDGQKAGTVITPLDKSFDVNGDQTATYNLTPPPSGWPKGTYKVEIDLMIDGAQKEQKTAEFTVG
jgi:hypothetical protein